MLSTIFLLFASLIKRGRVKNNDEMYAYTVCLDRYQNLHVVYIRINILIQYTNLNKQLFLKY